MGPQHAALLCLAAFSLHPPTKASLLQTPTPSPHTPKYKRNHRGTGTATEMAIPERETLAFEGVVVIAVDLIRPKGSTAAAAYAAVGGGGVGSGSGAGGPGGLQCRARITTRGMWTDNGRLLEVLHQVRCCLCEIWGGGCEACVVGMCWCCCVVA